jgi:hypothetical protein
MLFQRRSTPFPAHAHRDWVDFVDYGAILITSTLWGNRFAAAGFRLSYFRNLTMKRLRTFRTFHP